MEVMLCAVHVCGRLLGAYLAAHVGGATPSYM
jgi:hypothetical protein